MYKKITLRINVKYIFTKILQKNFIIFENTKNICSNYN